jgi:2-succinyl-6-hydroxy-2,4-cyclohexadiene-1-carboxylate synthase
MVMESGSPGIRSASEREERKKLDEEHAQVLEKGDFESFLHSWYSQPLFESLTRDSVRFQQLLLRRRDNDPFELATSLRWMGAGVQPSLWESLPQLGIPLLVLAGEYDGKYRSIADEIAARCRNARATVVPDAGHNVHAENPEAYTRGLLGFLMEKG